MAGALEDHARARNGPHGRFVGPFRCPLTRLDELDACVAAGLTRPPELCVVVTRGEIRWRRATSRADVSQIEAPPDEQPPTDVLRVQRYLELPLRGDVDAVIDQVARAGARVKVRCGGPAADLVPSSDRLARVVAACAARRVPLKATGGAHRPFRLRAASPDGPQHGFVNLLAAASAALAGADVGHLVEVLDTEEDEGSALLGRIDRHARLLVSVECSSLDDAVAHLQALGVL